MYFSGVLIAVIFCSFISLFTRHGATSSFLIYIPLHPFIITGEHAGGRGPNGNAPGRNFELRISRLQIDFKFFTGLLRVKVVSPARSWTSHIRVFENSFFF